MDPNLASEEDAKAFADIEKYGCHVLHIVEEADLPPFAYSIGIQQSCGAPELVVIGLKQPLAHFVINEYNKQVRTGARFRAGGYYSGFLESFDCKMQGVHRSHYKDYFGWGLWLYKGSEFEVLQLVYPTVEGIWPWDAEATEWFRNRQPLLETPKDHQSNGRNRIPQ